MLDADLSRFNLYLGCRFRQEGHVLLFNTLSGGVVLLKEDILERIRKGKDGDEELDKIQADLLRHGFLVDRSQQEKLLLHHLRQGRIHDRRTVGSKTLVTMQCNNRCRYCIIDREPLSMSCEIAEKVDRFYCDIIGKWHPERVEDDYLGGEPLLNMEVLEQSSARRAVFCRERGIQYSMKLTTNGRLLDPGVVERIQRNGLEEIRVSMAGPQDIHDRLRPGAGGEASYARILDNLKRVSSTVKLVVECQYEEETVEYRRIPEMLDDFFRESIGVAEVNFSPILPRRGGRAEGRQAGSMEKYLWLVEQARKRGLHGRSAVPGYTCMAELRGRFVFDCLGNLLPCPSLQTGEMAYGNVESGINIAREAELCQRQLPSRCREECTLLPLCHGGCRNQAMIRHGRFDAVDCHPQKLLGSIREYLRDRAQDMRLEISDLGPHFFHEKACQYTSSTWRTIFF